MNWIDIGRRKQVHVTLRGTRGDVESWAPGHEERTAVDVEGSVLEGPEPQVVEREGVTLLYAGQVEMPNPIDRATLRRNVDLVIADGSTPERVSRQVDLFAGRSCTITFVNLGDWFMDDPADGLEALRSEAKRANLNIVFPRDGTRLLVEQGGFVTIEEGRPASVHDAEVHGGRRSP